MGKGYLVTVPEGTKIAETTNAIVFDAPKKERGLYRIKNSALDEARTAGQNEAWELARKICAYALHGGYSVKEITEIFGPIEDMDAIFSKHSYKQAAQKVKDWEEEKKAFHVGDIVELEWAGKLDRAIVTKVTVNWLSVVLTNGDVDNVGISRCKKTGESVAISDILNQLKKEE